MCKQQTTETTTTMSKNASPEKIAAIDLRGLNNQLNKLEPFDDYDGILHKQASNAAIDKALRNISFTGRDYVGRFYFAGRVRCFAFSTPERLGDLARLVDVLYAQLRPLRQRRKLGDLHDSQLNFSVAQMEADVKYFFEKRRDVWNLITSIVNECKRGADALPKPDAAATNKTNAEKYMNMVEGLRRLTMSEMDTLNTNLNKKFDAMATRLDDLTHKVDALLGRLQRPDVPSLDITPQPASVAKG